MPLNKDTKLQESDFSLAGDFEPTSHDQWLQLVDKVLGGAPFDKKLVSRTYDGIAIQPLYTREDWNAAEDPTGLPGAAPFTRGAKALGNTSAGWDIRQVHTHPDPTKANAQILEDLERGVTSIVLKIDPSGVNGIAINSLADMETVLKGVYLDLAPVVLEPTSLHLPVAALFMQALAKKDIGPEKFFGNFGIDGFSSLAARGTLTANLQTGLARMADTAHHVSQTYPNARTFNVRSVVYHSAGASDSQELACAIGTAIEYLRAAIKSGLDVNTACSQIAFTVAADADFFLTTAKIRTLRRLWTRVTEVCGADIEFRSVPVYACSAPRMMSRRDPWVNILRTTVACFAAGIAGADAISVLPFDSAIGLPSDLARRIARNTQIVLQEESGLSRVIDPTGGAWMFEHLTEELADKAWAFFQKIESRGGMAEALSSGYVASEIATVHAERSRNFRKRKDPITGVSEFPNIHEKPVKPAQRPATLAPDTSGAALELPEPSNGTLTKALVDAVSSGASMNTMGEALRAKDNTSITPLPAIRLAEDFENLRDLGDAFLEKFGERPKVFLANIGRVSEFTARASFAKNFFEAGGFEAVAGAGGTDISAIQKEFKDSGASFTAICSSDEVYTGHAAELSNALKSAGAAAIYLAGRPGELEPVLKDAGVNDFIFIGCNAFDILSKAHELLNAG